jgi:hypothetical protein
MKRLLIVAGLAGLAYYLKRNPQVVNDLKDKANDLKDKATDALGKVRGESSNHSATTNEHMNAVH